MTQRSRAVAKYVFGSYCGRRIVLVVLFAVGKTVSRTFSGGSRYIHACCTAGHNIERNIGREALRWRTFLS